MSHDRVLKHRLVFEPSKHLNKIFLDQESRESEEKSRQLLKDTMDMVRISSDLRIEPPILDGILNNSEDETKDYYSIPIDNL